MIDREALLKSLPTHRALRGRSKSQQKLAAEVSILLVLDAIQAEEREPDHWESHDVLLAIGALAAGMYDLSTSYAIRALAPPERRIPLVADNVMQSPRAATLVAALMHISSLNRQNYTYSDANCMVRRITQCKELSTCKS